MLLTNKNGDMVKLEPFGEKENTYKELAKQNRTSNE